MKTTYQRVKEQAFKYTEGYLTLNPMQPDEDLHFALGECVFAFAESLDRRRLLGLLATIEIREDKYDNWLEKEINGKYRHTFRWHLEHQAGSILMDHLWKDHYKDNYESYYPNGMEE
ncbi:MAG: hypothetical protein KAS32_19315 [Candidatus Peribacteraceae bacterium]|nr:hypothetical protein [Candidatus Peribacteraceae bacterium]